jgi:hypothetical protein
MLAAELAMAWVSTQATYHVRPTREEEALDGGGYGRLLGMARPSGHCGDLAGLTAAVATAIEPSLKAEVVVGWYRPVWDTAEPTPHAWARFKVAPGVAVQADPTFGALTRQAGLRLRRDRVIFAIPASREEAGLFSVSHWAPEGAVPQFDVWASWPTGPWKKAALEYSR